MIQEIGQFCDLGRRGIKRKRIRSSELETEGMHFHHPLNYLQNRLNKGSVVEIERLKLIVRCGEDHIHEMVSWSVMVPRPYFFLQLQIQVAFGSEFPIDCLGQKQQHYQKRK